jgi:4-hydroxythreonine-4-phosphate dehydrogenase
MPDENRPLIAITIGDPAGIGPEVVVKALSRKSIYEMCRPLVIGDKNTVRAAVGLIQESSIINPVVKASDALSIFGTIDLIDMHNLEWDKVQSGQVSAVCGRASMEYVQKAFQLALNRDVKGIVTAPINKEATMQAGYPGLGHLEYLAQATGVTDYATMLVSGSLCCVHLTTHYSLREACDFVKRENIIRRLKLIDASFCQWGFEKSVIGVAGLNPHAGESGKRSRKLPRRKNTRLVWGLMCAGLFLPIQFLIWQFEANLMLSW